MRLYLCLFMLVAALSMVTCRRDPAVMENLAPIIYQPITEAQKAALRLSDSETRATAIVVSKFNRVDRSVFDGIPEVLVIRMEGNTGAMNWRVCLSKAPPLIELGRGGGWLQLTQFTWKDEVNCLQVKHTSEKDGWRMDSWSKEVLPVHQFSFTSRARFGAVDSGTAMALMLN